MSNAWEKFRLAVQCLAKEGSKRDCLAAAIAEHIVCLRPKELPAEVRPEFAALIDGLCLGRVQEESASVRKMVAEINDRKVDHMIHSINRIYDAVAWYQPIMSAEKTI
jgi:hypothetical protein